VLASCAQCHSSLSFKALGTTCVACHRPQDVHKGRLGRRLRRMCFWNVFPELVQRLRHGLRVRTRSVPRRNSTSSLSQMVANAGSRSFSLMSASSSAATSGFARRARAGDELPPHTLAQFKVLHLAKLGEAGRHAGLDGTLTQQTRAERMNGCPRRSAPDSTALTAAAGSPLSPPWPCARTRASLRALGGNGRGSSDAALRVKVTAAMCSIWYTPSPTPGGHALGQHLRLAGACARFDQDVGEQLLADGAARLLHP